LATGAVIDMNTTHQKKFRMNYAVSIPKIAQKSGVESSVCFSFEIIMKMEINGQSALA
jgi:hypothetical protein